MSAVITMVQSQVQSWFGSTTLPRPTVPLWSRPIANRPALVSYLLGLISPLPLVGLLFGVAAVVYGVRGLRVARTEAAGEGALQSWIGLALGGFFAVLYLGVAALLLTALAS